MKRVFESRDPWGHGMSLWILLAIVFLTPVAWMSLTAIRLENDVENWLSDDDPAGHILEWTHEQFPLEDRLILTWDDSSLNDPRVERLKNRLEGVVDQRGIRREGVLEVSHVVTPQDVLSKMVALNLPPEEAVSRMTGALVGTGMLRIRLSEEGRERQAEFERRLSELIKQEFGASPDIRPPASIASAAYAKADEESEAEADGETADESETADEEVAAAGPSDWPTVRFAPDRTLLEGSDETHHLRLMVDGMRMGTEPAVRVAQIIRDLSAEMSESGSPLVDELFYVAGSPVTLLVALSEAGEANRRKAIDEIKLAVSDVGIPEEQLRMGGSPVAATALNQAVKDEYWNPAAPLIQLHKRSVILLSAIVGALLAFVMLRSVRLAILVLAVSMYAMYFTVALVPATGGTMNMVLVVMPTLLMVLTLSGAIHVANYWRHAAAHNAKNPVATAVKMAWQPCALASLTTAIGLLSLTTSELSPVSDFGLYSAIGCFISLAMVLYALPALLQLWKGNAAAERGNRLGFWRGLGHVLATHGTVVTVGCLIAFGVMSYGLVWFKTETKVIRYFQDSSRMVQNYWLLENQLAGVVPIEVVIRFDETAQQELSFLQRMEAVRDVENGMRNHAEISGAISLVDFQPVSEPPPEGAAFLTQARYNRRSNAAEQRVRDGEIDGAEAFYTVIPEAHDLLEPGDAGLNAAGDEVWRITAQVNVMSDADYADVLADLDEINQAVLKYHPGAAHVVTGTVPLFLRTQQAVLDSLIRSFALAFGLIAIVMMILLRHPLAGLVAMLPNLFPVLGVFGLISWFGQRVDIGTMITASVALGIAVDGTLHLLTWFREGIAEGRTRTDAITLALEHCGPALWQTSAVVGIGLLMLTPSELLLISRFGWLMATLVGAALIADLIFLPALLSGPFGTLIERITPQRAGQTHTAPESPQTGEKKAPADQHAASTRLTLGSQL